MQWAFFLMVSILNPSFDFLVLTIFEGHYLAQVLPVYYDSTFCAISWSGFLFIESADLPCISSNSEDTYILKLSRLFPMEVGRNYDPYILLSPRPHSYIWSYTRAGCEYYEPKFWRWCSSTISSAKQVCKLLAPNIYASRLPRIRQPPHHKDLL